MDKEDTHKNKSIMVQDI